MAYVCRIYFDSTRGLITQAIRENELRVEYLRRISATHHGDQFFHCRHSLGGCGGAMAVMALGHIDPTFSLLDNLR
jgi:branched-chain amino acid transport system permease protein